MTTDSRSVICSIQTEIPRYKLQSLERSGRQKSLAISILFVLLCLALSTQLLSQFDHVRLGNVGEWLAGLGGLLLAVAAFREIREARDIQNLTQQNHREILRQSAEHMKISQFAEEQRESRIREEIRRQNTLAYWGQTSEQRNQLRFRLPYESNRGAVADRIKEIRKDRASSGDTLPENESELRHYLSLFEAMGTGVKHGVYSLQVVNSLDGPRIQEIWDGYKDYIAEVQTETGKPVYADLGYLAEMLGSRFSSYH